jgi:hypothetical protein
MAVVTCRTEGCTAQDEPVDFPHPNEMDEESGEFTGPPVDPWLVFCGPCGQQITDIDEAGSDAG